MSDTLASTKTLPQPAQAAGRLALRAPVEHDALVPGTRLDEFEIVRVLGAGGFGIVYLALDHELERQVAIKEYLPSALAGRSGGAAVAMRSAAAAETFALGLESFFNEARLLACFDHPSLVKVHRCLKAHGTAYMVMQFYPGITLKQARRGMVAAPDGAWLRAFVEPLLDVLELLHAEGVFHRDIAPDNILMLPDGRPVLLDFGSARRIVGDATQSLTAVLKPNFAPIEQYADVTGMRQGPWTDLYALGATVHTSCSAAKRRYPPFCVPCAMSCRRFRRTRALRLPACRRGSLPPSTGAWRCRRTIALKRSTSSGRPSMAGWCRRRHRHACAAPPTAPARMSAAGTRSMQGWRSALRWRSRPRRWCQWRRAMPPAAAQCGAMASASHWFWWRWLV